MLGLTLVTAITATVVVTPGTVAADQVSDLKAQAAQIAQDLVLEQLQIGADQQEYEVDGAKVQQDQAEIGSTQDQIQSDALRVSRDRKRLQAEAVSAYVNMDPSDGVLFEGNQSDAFAKAEYEDVTSGDTELTINALHTDENGLSAERATLSQQEAQDQATTNQEATRASAARQTQGELNAKQSEITGQLVAAVSQQQAVQAAAAAKAVRAAQAAAAAAAAHPHDGERSSVEHGANCACHHRRRGAGGRRRLVVRRPGAPSLPPVRPAGRVGRKLRGRVPGGDVHGRLPIQPAHMERSGPTGRHATTHQRPPEPGDPGRAGRPGHCAVPGRRSTALGRLLPGRLIHFRALT